MDNIFAKLGESYFVKPTEDPREALESAARILQLPPGELIRYGWGGPIHQFIHHPNVRDIMVQHDSSVWVRDRRGKKSMMPTNLPSKWVDFLAYHWRYANMLDYENVPKFDPLANFRSTLFFPQQGGGLRFQYVGPAFSAMGSSVYIRRLPAEPVELSSLVDNGTLPQDAADMLVDFLKAKVPIILSGQTGAGKTTFVSALANELQRMHNPLNMLVIEKSHEIPLKYPAYRWEEDADGKIDLSRLAANATQMGLEWLILGECTGPEAYFVLKAFNQGVPVLTTLHASSATAGLRQLAMLALEYVKEPSLLPNLMRGLADQAVVSIHLDLKERSDGGLWGQVSGIEEMISVSGEKPVVNPLWVWRVDKETGRGQLEFNRGSIAQLSDLNKMRLRVADVEFPAPHLLVEPGSGKKNGRLDNQSNSNRGFFTRR